ncbi:hypothetical protein F2Q68_00039460 [Brassica cretica]|uniref:Uncharacterized protein n=2 Tax=Brassica cretica TaxID=69181 RepID=A0A8S9MEG0_BRACR|nr:hypothetical protein F2Q68_00039460 [Brassica cretica]
MTEKERERERERETREENAEERETVRNVEGAVVFRDERGENESADTMVETKKKDLEGGYETEYEEDMQSGKRDKMDEAEDNLGRFEYEIEESVADFEDEMPTERKEILESSDDSSQDEIDVRKKRVKRRTGKTNTVFLKTLSINMQNQA